MTSPAVEKEVEQYVDKPHYKVTNRIDRDGQTRRLRIAKNQCLYHFDLDNEGELTELKKPRK